MSKEGKAFTWRKGTHHFVNRILLFDTNLKSLYQTLSYTHTHIYIEIDREQVDILKESVYRVLDSSTEVNEAS